MKLRKVFINALLSAVIICIVLTGIPFPFPGKAFFLGHVKPIMVPAGLWQNWKLFAPLPPNRDVHIGIRVENSDRNVDFFWLPQIETMSSTERYKEERFRKYQQDYLRFERLHLIDAARFLLRMNPQPNRTPVIAQVIELDLLTPSPGSIQTLKREERRILLEYRVHPDDLR